MPTYGYMCGKCGHEFERFQGITDKPIRKCPKCGKAAAKRLLGCGAGVIFKGSGFYQTDYRSEGYKKAQKSEKPASEVTAQSDNKGQSGGESAVKKTDSSADKRRK